MRVRRPNRFISALTEESSSEPMMQQSKIVTYKPFKIQQSLESLAHSKKYQYHAALDYIHKLECQIEKYNTDINADSKKTRDLAFNFSKYFRLGIANNYPSIQQKLADFGFIWNLQGVKEIREDYQAKVQEERLKNIVFEEVKNNLNNKEKTKKKYNKDFKEPKVIKEKKVKKQLSQKSQKSLGEDLQNSELAKSEKKSSVKTTKSKKKTAIKLDEAVEKAKEKDEELLSLASDRQKSIKNSIKELILVQDNYYHEDYINNAFLYDQLNPFQKQKTPISNPYQEKEVFTLLMKQQSSHFQLPDLPQQESLRKSSNHQDESHFSEKASSNHSQEKKRKKHKISELMKKYILEDNKKKLQIFIPVIYPERDNEQEPSGQPRKKIK